MPHECSVCNSPILREINDALAKNEPLRSIAKRSGFSRAGLSRHARRCIGRQRVELHGSMLGDLANGAKLVVVYPNERGEYIDPPGTTEFDIALEVHYDPPLPPKPIQKPAETTPK
jgi:hypothetical protein